MKKIILLITLKLCLYSYSFAQTADKIGYASIGGDNNFMMGMGLSYSIDWGATLKCDYILHEKAGVGIRPIISGYSYKDYITDTVNTDLFTINNNKGGHIYNFFVTGTYYLIGFYSESPGGFYVTLGAGYLNKKASTAVTDKKGQLSYNRNLHNKSFAGLFCLGEDYFVGPGKFFLEAPLSLEIYGAQTSALDNTIGSYVQPTVATTKSYRKFKIYPFLTFGYTFLF